MRKLTAVAFHNQNEKSLPYSLSTLGERKGPAQREGEVFSKSLARAGQCVSIALTLLILAISSPVYARAADLATRHEFKIPAQALDTALLAFSDQAKVQVLMWAGAQSEAQSPGAVGEFTALNALKSILSNTGLAFKEIDKETVAIVSPTDARLSNTTNTAVVGSKGLQLVQNENQSAQQSDSNTSGQSPEEKKNPPSPQKDSEESLTEVVVTGTHIHGTENYTSPLMQFNREDIRKSGYATTEQFVQSMPQNFGGGNSAAVIGGVSAGEDSNNNVGGGSGANLRGLGNLSTLVLVNGHRLAPAGVGNFVDLSMIPVGAIDRVDVLTDGASAIYGSDAVGGVVNIFLRRDFDGAETRARYGSVTSGDYDEYQVGQLFGRAWGAGSALASFDYVTNSSLDASDRSFTNTVPQGTDLIGRSIRRSFFGSASHQISRQLNFHADALLSERETALENNVFFATASRNDVRQRVINIGADWDTLADWIIAASAGNSRGRTISDQSFPDLALETKFDGLSTVTSVDAKADGPVMKFGERTVRLAVGTHYRRESYESVGTTSPTPGKLDRDVKAGFAELAVPIIDGSNRRTGVERLDLSLAVRHENYSDFGSTTDPKFGISWAPSLSTNFRATFGTSFRAPTFFELSEESFSSSGTFSIPDPVNGETTIAFLMGNRSTLRPEQAETWTVGFDLTPVNTPSFRASFTYFNIDFKDRIATPLQGASLFDLFQREDIYATSIMRSPDLVSVETIFARPDFQNFANSAPADVGAIFDGRLTNAAHRKQDGSDLTVAYVDDTSIGQITSETNIGYLFHVRDQATPTANFNEMAGTLFFPVKFRARQSLGWSRNGLSAFAFFNYTDNYRDLSNGTTVRVGSHFTVDSTISFQSAGFFRDMYLSLNVINMFDRQPPFVNNFYGINFDPTNASALGRLVTFQIAVQW